MFSTPRAGRTAGVLATIATAVAALTACVSPGAPGSSAADGAHPVDCTPLTAPEKMTFGVLPNLGQGTYYQAKAAGYLQQENLQVEEVPLSGSQDAIPLLGRGQLDAIGGGFSANIFNAIANGVDVRAVATEGVQNAEELASGFYVRSDLVDSGEVKTIADLRGRKVGLQGTVGGTPSYLAGLYLQSGGLAFSDVTTVPLNFQEMPNAFSSQAIDAGFVGAPYNKLIENDRVAKTVGDQAIIADQTYLALLFGTGLLKDRPRVGCAFLRANIRAGSELLAGDYSKNPKVVDAFVAAGLPRDLVLATPPYSYPDGLPMNASTVERMQKMFIDAKVLPLGQPLDFAKVTHESLRAAAVESLKKAAR